MIDLCELLLACGLSHADSACKADGILGRWCAYPENGLGGNRLLQALLRQDASAAGYFQFPFLRVMPATATKDEVPATETVHKRKLCSREFGLNGKL